MSQKRILDRLRYAVPFRRRRQAKLLLVRARSLVGPAFALPDFIVIGAMRAGTSSLFKYLAQHPDLYRSQRKEVEYFTWELARGEDWYRAHFAPRWHRRLSYEACPSYLFHPLAASRARSLIPDAKLIVLVRDPADRAYSHWQHMTRLGFETLSFREALDAEPGRIQSAAERIARGGNSNSKAYQRFSYAARGFYGEQLRRWLEHFPRERIHAIQFGELIDTPQAVLDGVCEFLGVSSFRPADQRNFSTLGRDARYGAPAQRAADLTETLERLRARYRDDQRLLETLL